MKSLLIVLTISFLSTGIIAQQEISPIDQLIIATSKGDRYKVQQLLKEGVDPNQRGIDPEFAVGQTPLSLAIAGRHSKIVDDLIRYNAIVTDEDFLDTVLLGGHESIRQWLQNGSITNVNITNSDGLTALSIAVWSGDTEMVKILLEANNIDVNVLDGYGETPLTIAAYQDSTKIVELLLGADNIEVNAPNAYGEVPLILAAQKGHTDTVKIFLGADNIEINATHNGFTALDRAKQYGHTNTVELLKEHGGLYYKQVNL